MTPLNVIWNEIPEEGTSYVRGQLGRMLFSGGDVEKRVGALSGGEAARLVFCRIAILKPNVLVLDEPTNHLDLESIHALVEALGSFEGTIVFVSHDRAFVSALATRILEVVPGGFRDFQGTYDEYLSKCGDDHLDADVALRAAKGSSDAAAPKAVGSPSSAGATPNALSWEEQKKRANRIKQIPAQRDAVLAAIDAAEARKAAILALFCEPGFFDKTPAGDVTRLQEEEQTLGPRIEKLLAEWEGLENELARLTAKD